MEEALSHDEESAVLERIVRNQLAMKELQEETDMLKQFFKDRPERYTVGTHTRGRFYVKITTNTRIDQKLAEKALSPMKLRSISSLKVDSAKARAILDEVQLAKITKTYDNKLEIGLAD